MIGKNGSMVKQAIHVSIREEKNGHQILCETKQNSTMVFFGQKKI